MQNFSLEHINNLNHEEARIYLETHFIPINKNKHLFINGEEIKILKTTILKNVYFNRIRHTELKKYYFGYKMFKALRYNDVINQIKIC